MNRQSANGKYSAYEIRSADSYSFNVIISERFTSTRQTSPDEVAHFGPAPLARLFRALHSVPETIRLFSPLFGWRIGSRCPVAFTHIAIGSSIGRRLVNLACIAHIGQLHILLEIDIDNGIP